MPSSYDANLGPMYNATVQLSATPGNVTVINIAGLGITGYRVSNAAASIYHDVDRDPVTGGANITGTPVSPTTQMFKGNIATTTASEVRVANSVLTIRFASTMASATFTLELF